MVGWSVQALLKAGKVDENQFRHWKAHSKEILGNAVSEVMVKKHHSAVLQIIHNTIMQKKEQVRHDTVSLCVACFSPFAYASWLLVFVKDSDIDIV